MGLKIRVKNKGQGTRFSLALFVSAPVDCIVGNYLVSGISCPPADSAGLANASRAIVSDTARLMNVVALSPIACAWFWIIARLSGGIRTLTPAKLDIYFF